MNIIIRQETEKEYPQIYDFVKIAFQTAKVSDGTEQDFVNKLRASGNYIPELALVAEDNGTMVGHIMLTKAYIIGDDNKFETLLLAPLAVALEYRNMGIGSQLIGESSRIAKEMGYKSVILFGNPAYYSRFGFRPTVDFNITHKYDVASEYVMACELVPDALKDVSGIADV